jgi:hypothetical protein
MGIFLYYRLKELRPMEESCRKCSAELLYKGRLVS